MKYSSCLYIKYAKKYLLRLLHDGVYFLKSAQQKFPIKFQTRKVHSLSGQPQDIFVEYAVVSMFLMSMNCPIAHQSFQPTRESTVPLECTFQCLLPLETQMYL